MEHFDLSGWLLSTVISLSKAAWALSSSNCHGLKPLKCPPHSPTVTAEQVLPHATTQLNPQEISKIWTQDVRVWEIMFL